MMTSNSEDTAKIKLTVNGSSVEQEAPLKTTLQQFLHHHLKFRDVRWGCGEGVCGACLVLLDNEPVASCLLLAAQADGRRVVTAAGLEMTDENSSSGKFRLLREQLLARDAFQCGYCACGMLVSASHHLNSNGNQNSSEISKSISGNVCRCSGYKQIEEAIAATAKGEEPPAVKYPRNDLRGKLDGSIRYPTDNFVEDALVGRVLWSEWPSAKIKSIDTSEALKIPGVEAVLTHKDIPGRNLAGTNVFSEDQPLLAKDQVRFMGEAVALVAARTESAARMAVQSIKISYEPMTPVLDVSDSLKPDAPKIGRRGNVIFQLNEVNGDVKTAFRNADVIVEDTYRVQINEHACMEPEGGSGWLEDGTLVITIPTHTPFTARKGVARALKLSEEQVRIVAPRMGGSFGKYLVTGIEGLIGLLVYKTGKAVRLVLDRQEALARMPKRNPFVGCYRLGLNRDGSFVALEADLLADGGPYLSLTPFLLSVFVFEATGGYEVPSINVRARAVLTNNLMGAPMRGFGSQQINFGIECIVEKAAHEIGMDPAELRLKNYGLTHKDGKGHKTPDSRIWIDKTMKKVVERLGAPPKPPPGWLLGRGMASIRGKYGYPYGLVDRFVARVSVDDSGRFLVESDVSDAGTGITAGVSHCVAEYLGLDEAPQYQISQDALDDPTSILFATGKRPSRFRAGIFRLVDRILMQGGGPMSIIGKLDAPILVRILRSSSSVVNLFVSFNRWFVTKLFPLSITYFIPRLSGSRSLLMVGNAALDAAKQLKASALSLASTELNASIDDLDIDGNGIHKRSDSSGRISWAQLAEKAGGKLAAVGHAENPKGRLLDPATGNLIGAIDDMDASHGCYVAVHPETGEVRILRFVACHDVGRIIDSGVLRGQVLGGIAMGVGQAFLENIVVKDGKVQTAGLHDYHVPTSLDVPDDIEIVILESGGGLGPGGAKGIGEAGAVASPLAITNALYDALGVQLKSITTTPEVIVENYKQNT